MSGECEKYALLMPVEREGSELPTNIDGAPGWIVSIARPAEGSLTARAHEAHSHHQDGALSRDGDAMASAVADFFARMRDLGLPGVLDAGEIRVHADTPLDFCNRLTEAVMDDLPDAEAEDFRDDDFENHPLAALREAMVEACPEYSGDFGLDSTP